MAAHLCPVCNEALESRSDRCFRCQTNLAAWWPLEQALAVHPNPAAAEPVSMIPPRDPEPAPSSRWALVGVSLAALLIGMALAGTWMRTTNPSPALPGTTAEVSPASASKSAPPPPPIRTNDMAVEYHVQRGDTLWRIASALTGDGRNWVRLWPDARGHTTLRAGTTLHISASVMGQSPVQRRGQTPLK